MAPIQKVALVLLIAMLLRSVRQYLGGCVCKLEGRLDNRVALVLAADTDIGEATVRGLARRGAIVVMACQLVDRCNKAKEILLKEFTHEKAGKISIEKIGDNKVQEDMIKSVSPIHPGQLFVNRPSLSCGCSLSSTPPPLHLRRWTSSSELPRPVSYTDRAFIALIYVRQLHLASLAEIPKFCEALIAQFRQLNILVVNGVYLSTILDRTVDGFERNIGMNYIAGFLITQHLLPHLEESAKPDFLSRIVFVSSKLHKYGELPKTLSTERINKNEYSWWKAYTSSQLALVTYANYLNTRVKPSEIRIVSVHPGFENRHFSSILYQPFAYFATWLGKTAWQSAQTTLYVTLMKPGQPGVYFEDCNSASPHPESFNTDAANELVKMTTLKLKEYMPRGVPQTNKTN
ncbi:hypothetical protein Aperf_G00000004983 [Anoplocephala perfoliata]